MLPTNPVAAALLAALLAGASASPNPTHPGTPKTDAAGVAVLAAVRSDSAGAGSAARPAGRPAVVPQVIVLTATERERTERFVTVGPTPGLGDVFVEHEVLRDRAGHRVLGQAGGTCTTVDASDSQLPPTLVSCSFTYLLPGGQITATGLVPRSQFAREVFAVTGGTGRYLGATGQVVTVLRFTGGEHDNTITVELLRRS